MYDLELVNEIKTTLFEENAITGKKSHFSSIDKIKEYYVVFRK